MSISNPANYVTSRTGGTMEGPIHSNTTAAPSPQASSQAGSSYAPTPSIQPLNPITHTQGVPSSQSTHPLSSSSRPLPGDPTSQKGGSNNHRKDPSAASSTAQRPPVGASGPRSNSFSNQALQQYPPSSTPGAAATPSTAAASLSKTSTPEPSSITFPTPSAISTPSDASTFTTSFTTYDYSSAAPSSSSHPTGTNPGRRLLPDIPGAPPSNLSPPTSLASLVVAFTPTLVASPTSDESSPLAPTPPPKSPRSRSFNYPNPQPGARTPSPLPSYMGSGQSKPATSTTSARGQPPPQKLQKANANAHQQAAAQHASSSAPPSNLLAGVTTTRSHVSGSPSPSPMHPPSSAPSSAPHPQSQMAPRPLPIPHATAPSIISTSDSSNSAGAKLKRAFGRRKADGATTLFGKGGGGASTASLVQHSKAASESSGSWSRGAAQRQLAAQLLGPSATASQPAPVRKMPSKTFTGAPVVVPPRSEVPSTGGPVEEEQVVSTASADPSPNSIGLQTSGMTKANVNRASIIQLSPGITSAVDYMREIGLAAEAREEGETTPDAGAGAERANEVTLDHETHQRRGDSDSGGKTEEGSVEPVQQMQGEGSFHSSEPTSTTTTSGGAASMSSSPPVTSDASTSSTSADKDGEHRERPERDQEKEKVEAKENWRKSDSTIGHHTIRTGGASSNGARSSRPVSMAESFQSAYTIVPSGGSSGPGSIGGNKRWSTVTGDLDFQVMMEDPEEEEEEVKAAVGRASGSGSASSKGGEIKATPTAKNINRRSLSLNVGIASPAMPQTSPAYVSVSATGPSHRTTEVEAQPISFSASESHATAATGTRRASPQNSYSRSGSSPRTLPPQPPRGAAGPYIAAHLNPHQDQHLPHQHSASTPLNIPSGRVPAWTITPPSATIAPPPGPMNPNPPPSAIARPQGSMSGAPASFRQTAISMSNGFAKRAAEKIGGIGKKWGISTSSSGSGYSSTSSSSRDQGVQPSSYSSSQSHLDQGSLRLGRTHSNESSLASSMKSAASLSSGITSGIIHHVHLPSRDKAKDRGHDKKKRRTPNAPSGAYSVASSVTSASTSDSDNFATSGPMLGRMVRPPVKNWNGVSVTGGVVFGKDLASTTRQTRAVCTLCEEQERSSRHEGDRERLVRELEHRMVPALVVRCAQHILIWGVQEEGLFRVSGRASHVAKLRSEFDTGVDYDLTDCAPGDLDPHAVASIFKAYLRELPEPILTSKLHRTFEAALTRELATYPSQPMTTKVTTTPTPGLPSGPKGGFNGAIRKPPSLSTLAMPSFNGMPAASEALVNSLRALVAELPEENRDLIRTVVELINATARASKDTKMPLSNLLLVFCPSLNMSPPLLKALCEVEGIWDPLEEVVDIRRETIYLDISADAAQSASDQDDDDFSDAREGVDSERQSLQSEGQTPSDSVNSGYSASAENSMVEEVQLRDGADRPPVPTLYLDSYSHSSSSSLLSSQEFGEQSRRDLISPQVVTSTESVDSLLTPVSSGQPSLSHLPLPDMKELHKKGSSSELGRPTISEPLSVDPTMVQFPPSPPTPQKRRSIPLLSLSSFSPITLSKNLESPSTATGTELRAKKPSLRRLFTKRSVASLSSAGSSHSHGKQRSSMLTPESPGFPPRTASDSSSISTPLSAVTAPQSSASLLPPVLDTPIEGSSLSLGLGLDISPPNTACDLASSSGQPTATTHNSIYASARSSQFSFNTSEASPLDTQTGHGPYRQRLESHSSLTASKLVLLTDADEEDWTQSVLIAAGAK